MAENARDALHVHMSAINDLDSEAMIASQHFPFVHFWPDGKIEYVASASEFKPVEKDSVLGSEWDHDRTP